MSALSIQPTYPIFSETNGQPLENGYIWVGTVNLDPQVNPINVYWDAALTQPAGQPIRTLNGYPSNNGTPARLYVNSDYSIRVMNSKGSLVYSAPAATERYSNAVINGVNAADVIYDPPFLGGVQTNVEAKLAQTVGVKDFGAVGDGVTDDTAALNLFFAAVSGNHGILEAGTYKITSQIALPTLSNCTITGVPGQTVITGSFGYSLMLAVGMTDVHWYGIEFNSTYNNAVDGSLNMAVLMQDSYDCVNVSIRQCKFKSPLGNAQALAFFNRTNASGTETCVIDGLWIEDNVFEDVGSIACTIYNRQQTSDKYDAAKRVYFNRNLGKNLGLLQTNNKGFLLSLDGFGSQFSVDFNDVDNPNGIGIENTGWVKGSLSNNSFRNFGGSGRRARAMSVADSTAAYPVYELTVVGNRCIDPATSRSYASFCFDSYFAGNSWSQTGTGLGSEAGFVFLDSSRNKVFGDTYSSDQLYAVRFLSTTGSCQGNVIQAGQFDTAASAINTAVINFDGASTSSNVAFGSIAKGTGGSSVTQTNSATGNETGYDATGTGNLGVTFAVPGDLTFAGTTPFKWTRKGNLCTVNFAIDSTTFTHTTAASFLRLTGLPFTVQSGDSSGLGAISAIQGVTKANYTQFGVRGVAGQTYAQIYASGSGQSAAQLQASDMPTGGTVAIYGSVTYFVQD
jgi:hypothetical protein